jgi:hypothetical protein
MARARASKRPHGQIRQSQLITTFGPGAMVDLPDYSVLIGGLDHWFPPGDLVVEPRLCEKLCRLLDLPSVELRVPPPDQEDPSAPPTGLQAWQFPEWFISQDVQWSNHTPPWRSRRMVHRKQLTKGKFIDDNRRGQAVVPIRFVRACRAGHIDDVDWYAFVHGKGGTCKRPLWIDERGMSGDLAEVFIRCECKMERSMAQAALGQKEALGHCNGSRPWLGSYAKEPCGEPSRLLIRTASNAYFTQVMSVISLPERDETVKAAVDQVWEFLSEVEDLEMMRYERKKAKVNAGLSGLSDEEVLAEILIRRVPAPADGKSVKQAELETLIAPYDEIGEDKPDGNFFARTLPEDRWRKSWMAPIKRVLLVQRLREVQALAGFTRFEALAADTEGELDVGVRRAALARDTTWLPAIENKGEGIFLQFSDEVIRAWCLRPDVLARGRQLEAGFLAWQQEHQGLSRKFPGLPYITLHTFAHLLMTAVSLECGYPASSIRERIYAIPDVGYGVLLFTGTSDAEGTLGGLIEVGRQISRHVRNALRQGKLCSNDPICAQHSPQSLHERRFLHGAACHGCVLAGETSCEQHNEWLDRALVAPTVENRGIELFPTVEM